MQKRKGNKRIYLPWLFCMDFLAARGGKKVLRDCPLTSMYERQWTMELKITHNHISIAVVLCWYINLWWKERRQVAVFNYLWMWLAAWKLKDHIISKSRTIKRNLLLIFFSNWTPLITVKVSKPFGWRTRITGGFREVTLSDWHSWPSVVSVSHPLASL